MHTIDGGNTFEMVKQHFNLQKAVGCDKITNVTKSSSPLQPSNADPLTKLINHFERPARG